MIEYTPKTWEIKHAYVSHCERAEWYERDIAAMAKEFDRWLARHEAEVAAKARYELLMMQLENVRLEVEAERAQEATNE